MSAQPASVLPTLEKPGAGGLSLHPGFYIANWMLFSNLTILFNKWLLDEGGFKYPILLTCWHLIFATIATQLLARTTSVLDSRKKVPMTGRIYLRAVVPIGILYSGSLVFSNLVYLYLSVAYIQMLKSAAPCVVLFLSWMWGLAHPTYKTWANIFVITVGVGLTSAGELDFSLLGFLFQIAGLLFEAARLVMIQILLSGEDMKMDPLVSLYFYAPVCAAMNCIVALFTEIPVFKLEHAFNTGLWVLLANAMVAFMLNVASVQLIGKTSSLVLTLAGILKSIILVITSVIIWRSTITFLQFFGYSIALAGLVYYSVGWDQIKTGSANAVAYAKAFWASPNMDESRLSPLLRRTLIIGLVAIITVMGLVGFMYEKTPPPPPEPEKPSSWSMGWLSSQLGWSH